jgi:hypothetical protein
MTSSKDVVFRYRLTPQQRQRLLARHSQKELVAEMVAVMLCGVTGIAPKTVEVENVSQL